MIKKTFLIAIRNLRKHPSHSFINIFGLTLGLATFIIISLYLLHEVSYDRFHPHADQTYRIINDANFQGVGETSTSSPCPLMKTMLAEYPGQIKYAGRVFNNWNSEYFIEYGEHGFKEKDFFFADSSIIDIFRIEFVRGNPATSLRKPLTALITEETAKKYFGDEDPVGKELRYEERFHFTVTGVIKDPPKNTHVSYDFLASMSSLRKFYRGQMPQTWYWNPFWTYVVLEDNVTPANLESQFPDFVEKYFPVAQAERKRLYLQPIKDVHLHSQLDYEIATNGNYTSVIILATIAVFMLIIAIINFMNLSTATAAGRAREIGIKKVLGSQRRQLILQFLTESIIMTLMAILLALIIIDIFLPSFNNFIDRGLTMDPLFSPVGIALLILLTLFTGVVAGFYPAMFLSKYKPAKVLKGNVSRGMRSASARKVLVIFQFAIAIALIIGTSVVFIQLNYLRNAELGFNDKNVILLPVSRTPVVHKYDEFEGELIKHPRVEYVTTTEYIPGTDHNNHEFKPEGYPDDEWQFYPTLVVREDFLKLFEIPIVEGRDYSRKNSRDKWDAILVNEAMVDYMGWDSNKDAIGKKFHSLRGQERVVGVFKNFNVKSLHSEQTPFVLNMKEDERIINYFAAFVAVRYSGNDPQEIISFLEKKWHEFAPSRPFEYVIHSNAIDKLYADEARLGYLTALFTGIIILIAVLGLFGLVSFMTNQRTQEIGIRRTLGAPVFGIVRLISKEFLVLVIIANLIAWPLAYLVLTDWLNNFAYHTSISAWPFVISGTVALVIALSITSVKAVKTSRLNPAKVLKYE